jgi:hypothetical protein
MPLECQNLNGLLGMVKRRPALVQDQPRFKGAYSKALGDDDWVFEKGGKTHTSRWTSGSSFTRAVASNSSSWRRAWSYCPGTVFHLRDALAAVVNDK